MLQNMNELRTESHLWGVFVVNLPEIPGPEQTEIKDIEYLKERVKEIEQEQEGLYV